MSQTATRRSPRGWCMCSCGRGLPGPSGPSSPRLTAPRRTASAGRWRCLAPPWWSAPR